MSEVKRPLKVFLFHAPLDKIAARELYLRLLKNGVDAWLVKERLLPGQDWKAEVRNAFLEADVAVICISHRFEQAEFRQKEARLALDAVVEQLPDEIPIILARLEECDPPGNLIEAPRVDLFDPEGYTALLEALRVRASQVGAVLQVRESSLPRITSPGVDREPPAPEEEQVEAGQGRLEVIEGAGILIEDRVARAYKPERVLLLAMLGFVIILMLALFGPGWIEESSPATPTPARKATRTPPPETQTGSLATPTMRPLPTIAANGDVSQIVFLVDKSGSMQGQRIEDLKSALSSFLSQLGDEYVASIIEFDTNVEMRLESARDRAAAGETIQSIRVNVTHDGSCLNDALYAGIQQALPIGNAQNAESILILFTDGVVGDNVGWNCTFRFTDESFTFLWDVRVPIFMIYVGEGYATNKFIIPWPVSMEGSALAATTETKMKSTLLSIAEAAGLKLKPKSTIPARTTGAEGVAMVFVPPGEFIMGDNNTVSLDSFWIDKTEVTNGMYAECVQASACSAPRFTRSNTRAAYYGNREFDNYPVIYVSWLDANRYCTWTGGRLPTEAEWEKAARGTDGRQFPWGDADPSAVGNLLNYRAQDTTEVAIYPNGASPYGALDMAGNVSEWVADWLSQDYYSHPPASNPLGPDSGQYRVWRGGSWVITSTEQIHTYSRTGNFPTDSSSGIGFRCARDAGP